MRLQAIFLDPLDELEYSSKFLLDLSGNAFCTLCVDCITVLALILAGRIHDAALMRKMQKMVAINVKTLVTGWGGLEDMGRTRRCVYEGERWKDDGGT